MRENSKKWIAIILTLAVVFSLLPAEMAKAATKKMPTKSIVMVLGESVNHSPVLENMLSAKSSNSSVVSVKKSKKMVTLKAKKAGTATITIKDQYYSKSQTHIHTYKIKVVKPKITIKYVGTTWNGYTVISLTNKTGRSFGFVSLDCVMRDAKGKVLHKGPKMIKNVLNGYTCYAAISGASGLLDKREVDYSKSTIKITKYGYDPEYKYTDITSKAKVTDEFDLSAKTADGGDSTLKMYMENTTFGKAKLTADILWYDESGKLLDLRTADIALEPGKLEEKTYPMYNYKSSIGKDHCYNHYVILPRMVKESKYAEDLGHPLK